MKQENVYYLIQIGLIVRYLRNAKGEPKGAIVEMINSLEGLIADSDLNFAVSLKGFEDLSRFKEKIKASESAKVSTSDEKVLDGLMADFEHLLTAEARTKIVFLFSERRYNTVFLLEEQSRLLGKRVYEALPEISRFDFRQGCRCIVFGEATAAAFHMLRATEGVLKKYYLSNVKRNKEKNPMWGNMVAGLRAKKANKPPTVLLDSLDLIRKSYRNPTNHPEAIYTLEEAQDLLGVCIDVINKMIAAETTKSA